MNLISNMLSYYRNFWNIYQLEQKASLINDFNKPDSPEPFSLVIVATKKISDSFVSQIKAQTRQPTEIIVVKRAPLPEVELGAVSSTFILADGLSPQAAKNRGITAAQHSIIVTLEEDFCIPPNLFAELVAPLEGNASIKFCAPAFQQTPFYTWLELPYAPNNISPLASWHVCAFRKIEWARIGGIPEDVSDFAGWSIFLAKFFRQEIGYFKSNVHIDMPAVSALQYIFSIAKAEGELGISATWIWKQVKATLVGLLLIFLTLISLLTLNNLGIFPFLLGIGLIFIWLMWWRVRMGSPLSIWQSGYYTFARFIAYGIGVSRRSQALVLLNQQAERHLTEIVNAQPKHKGIVLYFPTHDWGNMFQRPHQIARQFAKAGYLFFYGTRNEVTDQVAEFQKVEENLYLVSMPAVPPETFLLLNPILYIGATWHAPMLGVFQGSQSIYDHYDDLKVSGGLLTDHEFLLEHSSIVLASSHLLLEAVHASRPDALYIPNAVDDEWVANFKPHNQETPPDDLAKILRLQKPIVGYSGALAEWFDYSLLEETARHLPNFEFVLLGIDYDGSLQASSILQQANIHWLGQKKYTELFHYIWRFDVAIVPFKINDITLATSPIKLYEYFCCDKPVVSTALPEVLRYNEVLIAKNSLEFSQQIQQAYTLATSQEYQQSIRSIAHANTWKQRVQQITKQLK